MSEKHCVSSVEVILIYFQVTFKLRKKTEHVFSSQEARFFVPFHFFEKFTSGFTFSSRLPA